MKTTALTPVHIALGAKMAEFAGYNMPIVYSSINEEHASVRNHLGVFDVSHMGEFIIRGPQALDLVQKVISNDASKLEIGDIQYACLPNEEGGIVDDLLVYRLSEEQCSEGEMAFMLVVNASNIEKDWNWIATQNTFDTKMINISDQTGLLAVQGPKAIELLQKHTEIDLRSIPYYKFKKGEFAGIPNVLISATGYTGSGGFELYVAVDQLEALWNKLFENADETGIKPCGLGARDTLRLEMGFCLYGNDIDDHTSPLEAGLGWITKLNKSTDFIQKDRLIEQKKQGFEKKLVGFILPNERRVPRHGYEILNEAGEQIGTVTSGTQSPNLDIPIGMGYVKLPYDKVGTSIFISVGKKALEAKVVKLPFIEI